jgi:hypothetical protein
MALPRLLGNDRARRLLGLALTAQGLLGFLAPRLTAKLSARLSLREAYENPGDLEPTDAYVELVRDAGLGTLVFGALTLLRASTADGADAAAPAGETATTEGTTEPSADDAGGDGDGDGESTETDTAD